MAMPVRLSRPKDDVLSELDAPRQAFVATHAMGGQSIITCCEERQEFQNSHLILL